MKILPRKLGYLRKAKTFFNKEFKYLGGITFAIWIEETYLNYRNISLEGYIFYHLSGE